MVEDLATFAAAGDRRFIDSLTKSIDWTQTAMLPEPTRDLGALATIHAPEHVAQKVSDVHFDRDR